MVDNHPPLTPWLLSLEDEDGSDPSLPSEEEEEEHYFDLLAALSKKWLFVQLTHNVSAAATNSFWEIAMKFIPNLVKAKKDLDIKSKVPGFVHIRRQMYDTICPELDLKYAFLDKNNNSLEVVTCKKAPGKKYPKSKYKKLYEEAHVKVISTYFFFNIL